MGNAGSSPVPSAKIIVQIVMRYYIEGKGANDVNKYWVTY